MCKKSYLRYDKTCSHCDNAEAREAQRMEKEKEEAAEAGNVAGKADKKMYVSLSFRPVRWSLHCKVCLSNTFLVQAQEVHEAKLESIEEWTVTLWRPFLHVKQVRQYHGICKKWAVLRNGTEQKADRPRILALFIPSCTYRQAILGSRGRGVQPTTEREFKCT